MEQNKGKPVVLVVDDVSINLDILTGMVEEMGYDSMQASSVNEALELIKNRFPNIILLDIVMPEIDGYQMCEILKANPLTRQIPVIFVSAMNDIEDKTKAYELGAVDFIHKPFDPSEVFIRVNTHLKIYNMQKELEESNRRMNKVISEQMQKLEQEQKRFFKAMEKIVQTKEHIETKEHIDNMRINSRLLAQALNFTDRYENQISGHFVEYIEIAAAIHDIGKLTLSESALKNDYCSVYEEKEIINKHTVNGQEILEAAYPKANENRFIQIIFDVIRSHHENWDGSGCPDGLQGEKIPLSARIIRIIDRYNSLSSNMTKEAALENMSLDSGKLYDPYLLNIFLKIKNQLKTSAFNIQNEQ